MGCWHVGQMIPGVVIAALAQVAVGVGRVVICVDDAQGDGVPIWARNSVLSLIFLDEVVNT